MDPHCPETVLLGFSSVRLPPSVTAKLLLSARSMVIEAASVRLVISPRCPAVNVWAASSTDAVPDTSGNVNERSVLLFGEVIVNRPVPELLGAICILDIRQ